MDPIVTAGLGSVAKIVDANSAEAAKVGGRLWMLLLGPSAKVVGDDWAERLNQRALQQLLRKTQKRAEGIDDPGFTTPRLAAATFEAAQYADDEIVAEYLSGVLSSSRAPDGGNDEGLPWSAVIARLSTLQLRLHYLVYATARQAIALQGDQIWEAEKRTVVLPFNQVMESIGLDAHLPSDEARFTDAIGGLSREGLLGEGISFGPVKFLEEHENKRYSWLEGKCRKLNVQFDGDVLVVQISTHGVRLFLWGLGHGTDSSDVYMDLSKPLDMVDPDDALKSIEGAKVEEDCWEEVDIEPKQGDDSHQEDSPLGPS